MSTFLDKCSNVVSNLQLFRYGKKCAHYCRYYHTPYSAQKATTQVNGKAQISTLCHIKTRWAVFIKNWRAWFTAGLIPTGVQNCITVGSGASAHHVPDFLSLLGWPVVRFFWHSDDCVGKCLLAIVSSELDRHTQYADHGLNAWNGLPTRLTLTHYIQN